MLKLMLRQVKEPETKTSAFRRHFECATGCFNCLPHPLKTNGKRLHRCLNFAIHYNFFIQFNNTFIQCLHIFPQ
ncbi:Uncharacterised protein [Yersinia ruckeri]|nr:Uncharacterised protein [Yersinia ruckeri]